MKSLTFCVLILAMLESLLSLARGEVVLLSLPASPLAREVWGAEGERDLGRVETLDTPARLPRGLSH